MSEAAKHPANPGSPAKHGCCGEGAADSDTPVQTHAGHGCCGQAEPAHPAQSSCGCGTSSRAPEASPRSTPSK